MTFSRGQITAQLAQHGLAPRRAFGQNFVVDANTVRKIAFLAGITDGDFVLEIGAGLGSLTVALAETGAHITAVEIDNGLVKVLRENTSHLPNVEVIHHDAMQLNWSDLLAASPQWRIVANLPYNIATILVADILDKIPAVTLMLVMVQREVAERFVAHVGDPAYGAVSVKIEYWATAKIVGNVPASVFYPEPNVESALVEIRRRDEPGVSGVDPLELFGLVRAGFAKRRKMLRRALAGVASADVFERSQVAPTCRAEELDLAAWGRLCKALDND